MAAPKDPTGEDWAFFQIDVDYTRKTVTLRRITDTHHTSNAFASAAYLDATELYLQSKTNSKITRVDIPGKEALTLAGLTTLENRHTYVVAF